MTEEKKQATTESLHRTPGPFERAGEEKIKGIVVSGIKREEHILSLGFFKPIFHQKYTF